MSPLTCCPYYPTSIFKYRISSKNSVLLIIQLFGTYHRKQSNFKFEPLFLQSVSTVKFLILTSISTYFRQFARVRKFLLEFKRERERERDGSSKW